MRKLFLILTAFVWCARAMAQTIATEQQEIVTFRFVPGDDMLYARTNEPIPDNAGHLQQLFNLIDEYRPEITSGTMLVYVDGYSATKSISFVRANRVKSELILHKGLSENNFITKNYATAYTTPDGTVYRDMVVVTLRIPAPTPEPVPTPEPAPETERKPEPVEETQPTSKSEPTPEPVVEPIALSPEHKGWDIRTNLLYDALLTPTLGIEWRINDKIGIKLDGSWTHWGSKKGRVQKMWLVSPEVRWYLFDTKRLYVGLGANFGEANIYKGLASVLSSSTGYQGNIYGGGMTLGYRLPLCAGQRWAIDFNLGLGVTHFKYDTFTVSNQYRVYQDRGLTKNFYGPTQAGVSLVWKVCGGK